MGEMAKVGALQALAFLREDLVLYAFYINVFT